MMNDEKIIEGLKLTINNAEDLFSSATTLKHLGKYGISNSLYLLCCEEAIKAFTLYNYLICKDNRNIEPIFTSHNKKFEILKQGYHSISTETLAMKKSFEQAKTELKGKGDKEIEKRAEQLHKNIYDEIYSDYNSKNADDKWWDLANTNKQRGFYVGIKNLNWQSPVDISLDELNETADKTLLILGHVIQYKSVRIVKTN